MMADYPSWEQPSLPAEGLEAEPVGSTRELILGLQREGHGLRSVAAQLNARGIPTPSGRGQWWAATVRQYLDPAGHAADVARLAKRKKLGR